MLAKRIALGFGIAVILPFLVFYGVNTFSPMPNWDNYQIKGWFENYSKANQQEKDKLDNQRKAMREKFHKDIKQFEKHLFFCRFAGRYNLYYCWSHNPYPCSWFRPHVWRDYYVIRWIS